MPYHDVTGKIIEGKFKVDMFKLGCATGFYNGEGCSTLKRNKGCKPRPAIEITQKDKEQLRKLNKIFINLGRIYSWNQGHFDERRISSLRFEGFEKVQFVIACMWKGLSTEKKEQYKRILKGYYDGITNFQSKGYKGRARKVV